MDLETARSYAQGKHYTHSEENMGEALNWCCDEIERLRADAARWRCVRDTKGSDLLNTLLCAEPGAECDAVVDRWIATGGREDVAALRGEE